MINKRLLPIPLLLVLLSYAKAQTISIEESYRLARANYPAIKKAKLLEKSRDYDIQNAGKRLLPQVTFSGQATYQSQALNFSDARSILPAGLALPSVSKDQYRIQGDIEQVLYDGGMTRNQKILIKSNFELQAQNLEVSLYTLDKRINDLFFSILLLESQLKQNKLNIDNLQSQLQKTEAALANGTAFRSNLEELKAEIVNVEMIKEEINASLRGYLKMLSLFLGKQLTETTHLELPVLTDSYSEIKRPELKALDLQKSIYGIRLKQLNTDRLPKMSAFFQGALGRPRLNIIDNSFGPWFLTGLRFNWPIGNLYTLSNRKKTLKLEQQSVDTDRETFLFNIQLELVQQDEQLKKYSQLILQDDQAVELRASIAKAASAQLVNGVITIHEYIHKVNAEHLARQNRTLHQIQLLQAKYNYKFISGN